MRVPYLQHGRRHGRNGSDPITDIGIDFNKDNEGGWLKIVTNDSADLDGELGLLLEDLSGAGIVIAENGYGVGADTSFMSLIGDTITMAQAFALILGAGKSFMIYDSGSDPIFQVDEDGTIHIPTGGTIVADL